jgi:DNA-binding response OmpR family regulator
MIPKALVIDDDPDIIDAVKDILASLGHECDHANSVESARLCLERNVYTYVLLDLEIPVRAGKSFPRIQDGENLLEEIVLRRGTQKKPLVIVMTAHGIDGPELAVDIMKKGAADYVTKPFKSFGRTLDKSIREALASIGEEFFPASPLIGAMGSKNTGAEQASQLKAFSGGEMVYFSDRVELCGVDICSGGRSKRRRTTLDLLRIKKGQGFTCYSGEELAKKLGLATGQNGASGLIRDIRDRITDALRSKANIDCLDEDVILSGGPGYRLSEKLSVQDGPDTASGKDKGHGRDNRCIDDPNRDPDDSNPDDPNDPNPDDPDVKTESRRNWVLQELGKGRKLRTTDIVQEFGCSLETAKRDLKSLKANGVIEFVGTRRTGYYRLKKGTKPR